MSEIGETLVTRLFSGDANAGMLQDLAPEQRRLAVELHGTATGIGLWTDLDQTYVSEVLMPAEQVEFYDSASLQSMHSYAHFVLDTCLEAPDAENAQETLFAATEIYRLANGSVEISQAAVTERLDITQKTAQELFRIGQPADALLHAMTSTALRRSMRIVPLSEEEKERISTQAVAMLNHLEADLDESDRQSAVSERRVALQRIFGS